MDPKEFDFDQYLIGDMVEWRDSPSAPWEKGTVIIIDRDDPSLPWGVSHEPVRAKAEPDPNFSDRILLTEEQWEKISSNWSWRDPKSIRSSQYVIQEEAELVLDS